MNKFVVLKIFKKKGCDIMNKKEIEEKVKEIIENELVAMSDYYTFAEISNECIIDLRPYLKKRV